MKTLKEHFNSFLQKKYIIPLVISVTSFVVMNKTCWCYHNLSGDVFTKIYIITENPLQIFGLPLISFDSNDLLFPFLIACMIYILIVTRTQRQMRTGEEYGSSKWADKNEIRKFMDPNPWKNVILTATEGLTLKDWRIIPFNGRNKNILIVGGPGTGKTRFFVIPNLMQLNSSYVITDPKGTILPDVGTLLLKKGKYVIKILNLKDFSKSLHYNPLAYVKTELDILKFSNMLIEATKAPDEKQDFWVKAERLLYQAVLGLIIFEAPPEERTMNTLVEIIDASKTREDEGYMNAVDMLFDDLAERNPNHFAVRQYRKYKLAAGKSAKSVLLSCGVRLSPFDIQDIRDLMTYDEMELDKIGDRKTALFAITSDTDTSLNFIASFMYMQMFNLLCDKADNRRKGKLKVPVRCIFDEFKNLGKIPMFENLITTIRSRNISACPIVQTKSQLKAIYKDDAETIAGGCDSMLFLGGQEKSTLKDVAELLGSQTIDILNSSRSYGRNRSDTSNYQKTGRKLLDESEIFRMPGEKCILTIRGANPWYSDKYDITTHPNYKYLADYNDRNYFDIKKYIARYRSNADFKIGKKDKITEIKTVENSPLAN